MQVAYWFIVLAIIEGSTASIYTKTEDKQDLIRCVTQIINKYYKRREVTYVDLHYDDADVIKVINSLPVTVVSRDSVRNLHLSNTEYVITASNAVDFSIYFPNLSKESSWNPIAVFLIIIKTITKEDLNAVFDVLLKYHVVDAVVVNGTNDADSFIYNPFENYNCGKKYDGIIELGKCLSPGVIDFYPPKLVTGLRNCTFNVTVPQWPPFSMNPLLSEDSTIGIEQYILNIIGELEQFKVRYTGIISGEEFSTISANMSASGNLYMLQEKKTDIIFGGMMLIYFRAEAFNFLCGHLPYKDDVRVLVHTADVVPAWKNLYLEFDGTVWTVLIATFTGYFLLIVGILRVKDKVVLILMMWDLFFQHGSRRISKWRGVFIFWVILAYLISTYYQSSLVSITANPIKNYQISSENDVRSYRLEPCLSLVVQQFLNGVTHEEATIKYQDGCNGILESIHTVSKSAKKYTVTINYIYLYNRHLFSNALDEVPIYKFKNPMYGIIYAFYLYKGFPMHRRLHTHTIRLRENGLIDRYTKNLFEEQIKIIARHSKETKTDKRNLLIPWYILCIGLILSTSIFILELCLHSENVNNIA